MIMLCLLATLLATCMYIFSAGSQLEIMSQRFSLYTVANLNLLVPDDFLSLAAKAMCQLKLNKRTNVLYYLAKGMATPREDGSDTRLPIKRMPMGLIEHVANFFVAEEVRKVSCVGFIEPFMRNW